MNFNKKCLLIIFLGLSVSYSFAQTKTITLPSPNPLPVSLPPGNIKLLPGYTHERKQGIDSRVGEISKTEGITIRYDIGRMAGNYIDSVYPREKQNLVWIKNQKINNHDLTIILLKDGSIYATFTDVTANFISNVKNNEELTDFLLMILTYDSQEKAVEKRLK